MEKTATASSGGASDKAPRHSARRRRSGLALIAALTVACALALAACGSSSGSGKPSSTSTSGKPHHGGSITVLEGTGYAGSWPGLNPATDTDGAANQWAMESIFGELFELGPHGKLIDDLATGYKFTNGGKTVNIYLRKGVKFSDGTPFNAKAVAWNWERDLAGTCSCKPTFAQKSVPMVRRTGTYSVSLTLSYVDASFINALQDDIFNWIASPTSYDRLGAKQFSLKPVGAGPFEVVSDAPSSSLVLKANKSYWKKGEPYLSGLTFKSVTDDESAYEDMKSGDGQAYEGLSTPQLLSTEKKSFTVTSEPSTSPYDIQLNTANKPFNNITARKAIYYATNGPEIDKALFGDATPAGESFEAPAGLFYEQKVPGYLTYNLAKAKVAVKASGLDKTTIKLFTITSPVAQEMMDALQKEWEAAGMHVTVGNYDLSTLIAQFSSGKWQAALQTAGAYDPGTGVGVAFRFASTSLFSGVHDPHLDAILQAAAATVKPTVRSNDYDEAAAYIAKMAYGPFLFPINDYDVAAKDVHGEGLTVPIPAVVVDPEVLWETVYKS